MSLDLVSIIMNKYCTRHNVWTKDYNMLIFWSNHFILINLELKIKNFKKNLPLYNILPEYIDLLKNRVGNITDIAIVLNLQTLLQWSFNKNTCTFLLLYVAFKYSDKLYCSVLLLFSNNSFFKSKIHFQKYLNEVSL